MSKLPKVKLSYVCEFDIHKPTGTWLTSQGFPFDIILHMLWSYNAL